LLSWLLISSRGNSVNLWMVSFPVKNRLYRRWWMLQHI